MSSESLMNVQFMSCIQGMLFLNFGQSYLHKWVISEFPLVNICKISNGNITSQKVALQGRFQIPVKYNNYFGKTLHLGCLTEFLKRLHISLFLKTADQADLHLKHYQTSTMELFFCCEILPNCPIGSIY